MSWNLFVLTLTCSNTLAGLGKDWKGDGYVYRKYVSLEWNCMHPVAMANDSLDIEITHEKIV